MFYVYTLNILTDIYDFFVGIGNFFVNLWDLFVSFFTNVGAFLSFLLNGIIDTLTLLTSSIGFLSQFYQYVPAYASGFLAIFVAGVTINIIMEVT